MATLLGSSRALCVRRSQSTWSTQVRSFSTSPVVARKMPFHRYGLTDEQLAEFGGKKHLQKRLAELGLSPLGFRAVLRNRMKEFVQTQQYTQEPNKASQE